MAFDISLLVSLKQFPTWVYWFAASIQGLGIIVSLLISYMGFKAYKITKESKYKYFFYGFLFLALNFIANITLNVLLRTGYAQYFVENRYSLYVAPLFGLYYFFWIGIMLAYVSLAAVYTDIKKSQNIMLFYFWTFIVGVYVFRDKVLFNMFSALLISFIVVFTYQKYQENKNKNMLLTFWAFFCLFLFHLLVIIEVTTPVFYVIRYFVLLIGLVLLLSTLLKIYGGKKK